MGFQTIPNTTTQYGLISFDENGKERLEGGRNLGVIHQPPQPRIALARHHHLHPKTMAVEAATLVRFGQARQQMSRFKLETLPQFHVHKA